MSSLFQIIVITLMFYSFTKNHYIANRPLHPCLMAQICNHTGIKMCGLEKDQGDVRLFLDDCDMFEYNCDYKKAYSKVDDKLCKDITESNTENPKTSTSVMEESTLAIDSSQTTTFDKHTTSDVTYLKTTATETKPKIITLTTESMKSVSGITTSKNSKTTTEAPKSQNVSESISGSTYANISRIPIAFECTRGKQNSTYISSSKKQNIVNVTKSSETINNSPNTRISSGTETRCTCLDTDITTSLSHLETHSTTTPTYLETKESTTSPVTKTQINTEIVSTSAQTKSCTCNSVSLEIYKTINTQTELVSEIITTPTNPMTSLTGITSEKCTCADVQTIPVPTTKYTITSTQSKHECTCPHSRSKFSSISTINDETIHNPLTKDESLENTLTTVEYEDVDTKPKHSCDKYPKDCERPLTWETTLRGETRDFFQILRERFGDRVKILRDTTHWPRRSSLLCTFRKQLVGRRLYKKAYISPLSGAALSHHCDRDFIVSAVGFKVLIIFYIMMYVIILAAMVSLAQARPGLLFAQTLHSPGVEYAQPSAVIHPHPAVEANAASEAQLPPELLKSHAFYSNPDIAAGLAKESWFTQKEMQVVEREAEKIPRQRIYDIVKHAGFLDRH